MTDKRYQRKRRQEERLSAVRPHKWVRDMKKENK